MRVGVNIEGGQTPALWVKKQYDAFAEQSRDRPIGSLEQSPRIHFKQILFNCLIVNKTRTFGIQTL